MSNITIASNTMKHIYTGNGLTTQWPYTFKIFKSDDIKVYLTDQEGVISKLTGGYRVLTDELVVEYPYPAGTPLPANKKLTIMREVEILQEMDLINQGAFFAKNIEQALDRQTAVSQQLAEELSRAVRWSPDKLPEDFTTDPESMLTYINEQGVVASTARTEAEAARDAAQTAETNAAASAVAAAGSEAAAEQSESNAMASKLAAASSEQNANAFAATAFAASAPAWSADTIYNFPTVVAYTDGHSYRCVGQGVLGDVPGTTANWVRVTVGFGDYFDYDENGDLMPSLVPENSDVFVTDSNGDIMPKA